jgi:hypothetical protein
VRSPLALGEGPTGNWIERLEPAMRRELDRTLRALRRDRTDAADALSRALVAIVARGDAPDDQLTVSAL